jgi:iron complex outermembrane receptor protein
MPRILYACVIAATLHVAASGAAVPEQGASALNARIPAQPLDAALSAFAEQTHLQLVYVSGIVAAQKSREVRAGISPADALVKMLGGTGLRFEYLNPRTVRIFAAHTPERTAVTSKRDPDSRPAADLEQVMITGSRREQLIDKTPVDVIVWNQDAMQAAGIKSMTEIGALTPGLEFDFFSSVGGGVYTNMAMRGVTDRHGNVTGVWFDGLPLPPAGSNTFARALPFYFDLDQIEVLRGPQGTLLGANSQGGAVRFVPNQPSLTTFSGLARAEWATTARGAPSFEAGAAAGGPIVPDRLAFRVSAWSRADGGYVARVDPFTGATLDGNSNRATSQSIRGALSFAPTGSLLISPSVSYVSTVADDSSAFFTYLSDPGNGRLRNGSLIRQPFEDRFYLAALRLEADLGTAELTMLTGYVHRTGITTIDDTQSVKWGGWGNPLGPAYPASYADAVTTDARLAQRAFSFDTRLASANPNRQLSWVAGAFFARTQSHEADRVVAGFIPVLSAPLDASNATSTVQSQLAGFGQIDLKITGRLTLTTGLRVEREEYDSGSTALPMFHAHRVETLNAPRIALSYESGTRDLYYVSATKGYAPGGVDAARPTCFENPSAYPSDTLWSYELGTKRPLLEGRAHVDVSIFHIRWNNGPLATGNCLFTHLPGSAASDGFDVAAQAFLGDGFRAGIAVSYVNARYTQTLRTDGQLVVQDGDALGTPPLVTSPWNLTATIERRVVLGNGIALNFRAQDAFHSRNPGPFHTSDPTSPYYAPGLEADPATNLLNLGANLAHSNVELGVFVNNALDAHPTLLKRNKGVDVSTLFYATTLRPRTLGISVGWRF